MADLEQQAQAAWLTYRDEYTRANYLNPKRAASQMRRREFIAGYLAATQTTAPDQEDQVSETPDVQPGQVWADNDWRSAGRTLRVESIDGDTAFCTVVTNATQSQERIDKSLWGATDTRGKTRRIKVSRFRPNSTGYRLVVPNDRA